MDFCTLIVAATITAQMCYSPPRCSPSADGTKSFCVEGHECGISSWPTYQCQRPDGSSYTFEDKFGAQGGMAR